MTALLADASPLTKMTRAALPIAPLVPAHPSMTVVPLDRHSSPVATVKYNYVAYIVCRHETS